MVHIGKPYTSLPYAGGGGTVELDPDLVDIGELEAQPNTYLGVNEDSEWELGTLTAAWRALFSLGALAEIRDAMGLEIGADVQAAHANLVKLAAATLGTNKLLYVDGSGDLVTSDLTAAGRDLLDDAAATNQLTTLGVSTFIKGLLDDADAATAQATLGLVPGTHVQAYDADLASIAALSTAAFGRSLLTTADAAAVHNLLPVSINAQTGTSYTLVLTDAQKMITTDNSGANKIMIPTDAAVALPVNTMVHVLQIGSGQTTFEAVTPGTTTVQGAPGLHIAAQFGAATAVKIAANSWVVFGALVA